MRKRIAYQTRSQPQFADNNSTNADKGNIGGGGGVGCAPPPPFAMPMPLTDS